MPKEFGIGKINRVKFWGQKGCQVLLVFPGICHCALQYLPQENKTGHQYCSHTLRTGLFHLTNRRGPLRAQQNKEVLLGETVDWCG